MKFYGNEGADYMYHNGNFTESHGHEVAFSSETAEYSQFTEGEQIVKQYTIPPYTGLRVTIYYTSMPPKTNMIKNYSAYEQTVTIAFQGPYEKIDEEYFPLNVQGNMSNEFYDNNENFTENHTHDIS